LAAELTIIIYLNNLKNQTNNQAIVSESNKVVVYLCCVSIKQLVTMAEPVNALALIKEEMQTEEIHLKVNAIHRLKTVILTIGPEQVNSQLIPYLFSK